MAFALAIAMVVAEAMLPRFVPPTPVGAIVWVGGTSPHPVLGEYYAPNTTARTVYPDNPRGYFDHERPKSWRLEFHDQGSAGTLELPADKPTSMRIAITKATNPAPFNIQLNEAGLAVTRSESYQLSFRARADSRRSISFGISMAHAPWEGLGFYRDRAAGPEWEEYSELFKLTTADENARLHFDLGASAASVDIEDVILRRMPSTELVRPPGVETEYSVTYRFNGLGCRGRDYPIPRPAGRKRILAIGDSYTLGVGVHEPDTLSARLERSLNAGALAGADKGYDVINCGVAGYATREERLFYELIGSQYEPEVVLVTVVSNDDLSWLDEVRLGYAALPGKYDSVLLSSRVLQAAQHQGRRPYDYSASMKELAQLREACEKRHVQLAVVLFANDAGIPQWQDLGPKVAMTLAGSSVPILDLGPLLFRDHSVDDLKVHRLDGHPNQIAHQIAAREIERFLREHKLVD